MVNIRAQCISSVSAKSPVILMAYALGQSCTYHWRPKPESKQRPRSSLQPTFHLDVPTSTSESPCTVWEPGEPCNSIICNLFQWMLGAAAPVLAVTLGLLEQGESRFPDRRGQGPGGHHPLACDLCSLELVAARAWPKWGAIKFGAQDWGSRYPGLREH